MIIRSISGVRGLVDTHLNGEEVRKYARALHHQLSVGVIIIGRDSRPSGDWLADAFVEELLHLGRDVIGCGIVPTPTVQFLVEHSEAAGGVVITASHNPIEWNGLKFIRSDGTFFRDGEWQALFQLVDHPVKSPDGQSFGVFLPDENAVLKHVLHIVSLKFLNLKEIRKRKFKVVVDAVNGAGSDALPQLLESLGCSVTRVNCDASGEFTRGPEPLPEHLQDLCRQVVETNADVGLAVDPDADRLAVVSEKGIPLGEEYTLVLAAESYLKTVKKPEVLVTNLSSSLALEKMAANYNSSVRRAAVGEINVVEEMLRCGANLGGEGNGGVILKAAHLGRDSLVGAAMILSRMALEQIPISQIHATLPQFKIVKDRIKLRDLEFGKILKITKTVFADGEVNTVDGIKFSWSDRWIHMRKSNTEPIVRIYAEGPTVEIARELIQTVKDRL
ncbi:MAG: phosphoglucosamine mutase [Fidelibacterota bacterium]